MQRRHDGSCSSAQIGWTAKCRSNHNNHSWGGDVVMDERAKDEVLAAYAAYVAAFRANDIQAIDKLMQYPLAHIGNGETTLLDTSHQTGGVDGRQAVA